MLATAAAALGGCSVTFPMASLAPNDAVTGSIATVPFGGVLDAEDSRREKAALATALDPQGDGATTFWENSRSGHKGAISADGRAYTADGKICRAFTSALEGVGAKRSVSGVACAVAAGDWVVQRSARSART